MNFDFSEEQYLLRDQARKFLDDRSAPAVVRAVLEDDDKPYDAELWREMAELGWIGTTIPEEFGGAVSRRHRSRPPSTWQPKRC